MLKWHKRPVQWGFLNATDERTTTTSGGMEIGRVFNF